MAIHAKPLVLRLLGDMTLECDGVARALPKSRKTRALLAYLAIHGCAIRRETLCDMLWESANDPRAALRWSLSKLRPLLETPQGQALRADAHGVALDPALVAVDAQEAKAMLDQPGIETTLAHLELMEQVLAAGYPRDFDLPASYRYQLWIGGEREVLRRVHRRVLDELGARAGSADMALATARKRAALDPLDNDSNARLLVQSVEVDGRIRARAALEGMRARYRAEGISDHALVASWRGLDPAVVLQLPDKPSVAVLGFMDLGGHEHGPVLAEGLAADLTLALGHMRGLFVTARASSARFPARSADLLPLAGRMLGVRYLVHGTTQRLDRRVRINVTLSDAVRNDVLWCEHFDRAIDDLFSVQDDVSAAIASAIEPAIARAEGERARLKSSEDLSAWECYHRAMWHCYRFTAPHTEQAHAYLLRALALDKGFARAHAGLSFTHYSRAFLNAVPAFDAEVAMALRHAHQSIELDPRDAMGHWTLGRAQFLAQEQDQALRSVGNSLAVNPNFAQGHYALGFMRAHAGLSVQALPALATAERLSPYDPMLFAIESARGLSLAIEGKYDEASAWAIRATSEPNAHFHILAIAAACLVLASRHDEARAYALRACRAHPGYSIRVFQRSFPQKFATHRELLKQALRIAGVPDGEP